MIITVASGKGGTGKTLIATSLALSLARAGASTALLDCDVEAPNDHLFVHPRFTETTEVTIPIPRIDEARCTHCGKCAEACLFNAIAVAPTLVLVFDDLCHGCGACTRVCPEEAITEYPYPIGTIARGEKDNLEVLKGELTIGKPLAPPIIRELIRDIPPADYVILDAPPGTSCSLVATLKPADYALFVTEPSPFGLHDLRQAIEVAETLHVRAGIIINRQGDPFPALDEYIREKNLPVLLHIPFDRRIAAGYAAGRPLVEIFPEYRELFLDLVQRIGAEVQP